VAVAAAVRDELDLQDAVVAHNGDAVGLGVGVRDPLELRALGLQRVEGRGQVRKLARRLQNLLLLHHVGEVGLGLLKVDVEAQHLGLRAHDVVLDLGDDGGHFDSFVWYIKLTNNVVQFFSGRKL